MFSTLRKEESIHLWCLFKYCSQGVFPLGIKELGQVTLKLELTLMSLCFMANGIRTRKDQWCWKDLVDPAIQKSVP